MLMKTFDDGYVVREVSLEEYRSYTKPHYERVFSNRVQNYVPVELDDNSRGKIIERSREKRFELRLLMFKNDDLVGWHYGCEQSAEVYYMQNSAVLENHRNQKLYSRLLDVVLDCVHAEGFQVVVGTHHPHNAAVLIPKIKRGFFISGMQFNENFGSLVELKYIFNTDRRGRYYKNLGLEL